MLALISIAVVTGSSFALAISPIWSNVVPLTVTQTPWVGTVVLSTTTTTFNTGQSIVLTGTLNPLPTDYQKQQAITFYFSTSPIALDVNGNPTNPAQLMFVGANQAQSTVTTIDGVATLNFIAQEAGQFYFIGKIETPV